MKVLVTGSTGLVGTALVSALAKEGHTVCRLVRPESRSTTGLKDGFDVAWNPATGELGGAAVGADGVVNLAGASIVDGRWTAERKRYFCTSRIESTRALVTALAKMNARPRVLISASGIGIHGNRGDELLTEESSLGNDFLAQMAKDWEAEAAKAEALGIRVVRARIGVVLAKEGGALPKMMAPFKVGLGGRLGSGKQWTSWVALDDTVAILKFALEEGTVRGAINVVAPNPVRNAEFAKALGAALKRPAIFPVPVFVLRLAMGEMADALLLASQRALPKALEKLGYKFLKPGLSSALKNVLCPS